MSETQRQLVMDERAVERTIARMAREIIELNQGVAGLILMGVRRRGIEIAARLADEIEKAEGNRPPVGTLDITLYRDDLTAVGPRPVLGQTHIPGSGIDGKRIVIVDDVCYTGRTVRAALDELADFGRPSRIFLSVLVDRGGRELPIQPDVVGRAINALPRQRIEVLVPEIDGRLGVEMLTQPEPVP